MNKFTHVTHLGICFIWICS